MLKNLGEYVTYYLDRLEGSEAESAFHSLIEAPREALPLLVEAYHQESCSSKQAAVVEVVCQFRDANTIPFLAAALHDGSDEIWKQALDGLVTMGGDPALEALRNEKNSLSATCEKAGGIDEAIEQIRTGSA